MDDTQAKPRAIHQMLPVFQYGDAIGNQVLEIRQLLRAWGYSSEIFAEHWDPRLAQECHSYRHYRRVSHEDNLLILHYSTGGSRFNGLAQSLPDCLVLYYHNITPAHFMYWVNGELAYQLQEARDQLKDWTGRAPAIAGSPYNAEELNSLGFTVLGVAPYIIRFEEPDRMLQGQGACEIQRKYSDRQTRTWLHVGRIAPNKSIHDLIKSFYYYHTWITPASRLFLVGSSAGMAEYVKDLAALVKKLDLEKAVIFTGHVETDELAAFYALSDLYLSMSEHEGFCIPLIEAMHFGLPVMAYSATGVPFTMGSAGVLLHQKNHALVAEMAHEILTNAALRSRLVEMQYVRSAELAPSAIGEQFRQCLDSAISFWRSRCESRCSPELDPARS